MSLIVWALAVLEIPFSWSPASGCGSLPADGIVRDKYETLAALARRRFLLHLCWERGRFPPIELFEYTLLAFGSLFVIVDPISTVPVFLAMTPGDAPAERIRITGLACCVMAGVLIGFSLLGSWLFQILGITLPAFQIAGSIVLLLMALDMLRARRSRVQETPEETSAGMEKEDIAITPLAVPLLSGPGAISTVILLRVLE